MVGEPFSQTQIHTSLGGEKSPPFKDRTLISVCLNITYWQRRPQVHLYNLTWSSMMIDLKQISIRGLKVHGMDNLGFWVSGIFHLQTMNYLKLVINTVSFVKASKNYKIWIQLNNTLCKEEGYTRHNGLSLHNPHVNLLLGIWFSVRLNRKEINPINAHQ